MFLSIQFLIDNCVSIYIYAIWVLAAGYALKKKKKKAVLMMVYLIDLFFLLHGLYLKFCETSLCYLIASQRRKKKVLHIYVSPYIFFSAMAVRLLLDVSLYKWIYI